VRRRDDEHVTPTGQAWQVGERPPPSHAPWSAAFRMPPYAGDRHAEGKGPPGDGTADPAEPDDPHAQLPELAHRDRAISEILFGPASLPLRGDHAVETTGEIRDRGDDPVSHGAGVDAGGSREHHAAAG